MKIKNALVIFFICFSIFGGKVLAAETNNISSDVKIIESKTGVSPDKKWTVKFTKELNAETVNKDNIQVFDSNGQAIDVSINLNSDKKLVDILPPSSKYSNGKTYSILIKKNVMSKNNNNLPKDVKMDFTIVKSSTEGSESTNDNVDPALLEASNGLVKVESMVKTDGEKALTRDLKSAVDLKIKNPSINIDTAPLKSKYYGLSKEEQEDFKSAIFSKLSIGTLLKIKGLFQ